MKNTIIMSIFLVVLISGCTGFPGVDHTGAGFLGFGEPDYTEHEEISIDVETFPTSVRSGRNMDVVFDLVNSGNTTPENIQLRMVDICSFQGLTEPDSVDDKLEPGDKTILDFEYQAPEVSMGKRCDMKYRVSYESLAHATFSVNIMDEDEYITRERMGNLAEESNVRYEKTRTPVEIVAEISQEQPILEGDDFLVHIHLENKGDGFVVDNVIEGGDVEMYYPDDILEFGGCQDMDTDDKPIVFEDMRFRNGRTPRVSCRFSTDSVDLVETATFRMDVDYTYVKDGSFFVNIEP